MKSRFLTGSILLTVSAFAQQAPGSLNHFQAFQGMTKQQALNAVAKANKIPKLLYAENFFVVPEIVDGLQAGLGVWTTELHIVNLDPNNTGSFELDFFNQNGTAATVGIVGQGPSTSILGTLNPGQIATYVTAGEPASVQVTWAQLNNSTTGAYVSVYETINLSDAAAHCLSSMSGPSDYGVNNYSTQPGVYLPFDNTNGALTAAAFANPDSTNTYNANTLQIQFIDAKGQLFDTETLTIPPGNQVALMIASQWPKTANLAGTLYILPYTPAAGSTPPLYPDFSPITLMAIQARYVPGSSCFSYADSMVPLMTVGSY
jgi:hypothetical protein